MLFEISCEWNYCTKALILSKCLRWKNTQNHTQLFLDDNDLVFSFRQYKGISHIGLAIYCFRIVVADSACGWLISLPQLLLLSLFLFFFCSWFPASASRLVLLSHFVTMAAVRAIRTQKKEPSKRLQEQHHHRHHADHHHHREGKKNSSNNQKDEKERRS